MALSRRQILQASLFGGLASTFGRIDVGAPEALTATAPALGASSTTLDAFQTLVNAIRKRSPLSFGVRSAYAAEADEMVVVTIKVMNHIHTPLCFKLGKLNVNQDDVLPYTGPSGIDVPWSQKVKSAATLDLLTARGVDKPSSIERFRRFRMNNWWASILNTGMVETNAVPNLLSATDVGAFPLESEVALQVALGVSQTDLSLNHSFKNCSLPMSTDSARGGDIGYHCAQQRLVTSPLGLVCFNMGVVVETTDSIGNVPNRVVANDLTRVVALGRSVDSYVDVLRQAVGLGLVDEALVAKFSALVNADSSIADELTKRRATLESALSALGSASQIELAQHQMAGVAGAANLQAIGTSADQVARGEFLAQCKFVQRALEVPGKPFRNFTLMLNIVDLDGAQVDVAPPISGSANPYSYVEGMRQLAVGLNMLAQVIKKHRDVYVVVVSEGGRSANRADNKVSHAMVMGPGGAGRLRDYLYADTAAVESTADPFRVDPNDGNGDLRGTGQRIPSGGVVANEAGATINEHMTVGALLGGLVRHLEARRGLGPTTAGLGKFVRIQTK